MSNRSLHYLTPDMLLRAYAAGIFPMAESADASELHWYDPPVRALIPLDDTFHVPRSLKRKIRQSPFKITINQDFERTMRGCAEPQAGRETTWINSEIIRLNTILHRLGHAHSLEVWNGAALVGGLYGISLGAAFFAESMFSRQTDASKIALVTLVDILRQAGYILLDTQFQTNHLARFGTFEITRSAYHHLLAIALQKKPGAFTYTPRMIP